LYGLRAPAHSRRWSGCTAVRAWYAALGTCATGVVASYAWDTWSLSPTASLLVATNGVCGYGGQVPARIRADDAYAALRHIEDLPNVRSDKIGLMGHSHGGRTVLAAMDRDVASEARETTHAQHSFAAGIAFYPECTAGAWVADYHAAAPLLILAGELDDWTPSAPCQRLADSTQKQGQPLSIKIYRGALHSFDSYAPIMRVPEARQGRGATIGGNPDAREDSAREVEAFFGRYLKDSGS
jgi:dienelactone hydrolase